MYIVTTDDRRMFACRVEPIGPEQQRRWFFVDTDHLRYVGPQWWPGSDRELLGIIKSWWEDKGMLGQQGVNAELAAWRGL